MQFMPTLPTADAGDVVLAPWASGLPSEEDEDAGADRIEPIVESPAS